MNKVRRPATSPFSRRFRQFSRRRSPMDEQQPALARYARGGSAFMLAGLAAIGAALAPTHAAAADPKPNVVFILADNVGYGDLGPYGGGELRGAPTPRTDQLAREGLRLTQFLVEPACTPSRAALMTGRYSIREGLSLILVPDGPNTLSAHSVTM